MLRIDQSILYKQAEKKILNTGVVSQVKNISKKTLNTYVDYLQKKYDLEFDKADVLKTNIRIEAENDVRSDIAYNKLLKMYEKAENAINLIEESVKNEQKALKNENKALENENKAQEKKYKALEKKYKALEKKLESVEKNENANKVNDKNNKRHLQEINRNNRYIPDKRTKI